MMHCYRCS